jgi:predicted nuclease of predicted toxin-antitoxin system
VKLADFGLLTDENIDPAIVAFLRSVGFNVTDVVELGWQGKSDAVILDAAFSDQRVVVTHDADFGRLAILARQSLIGIIYLRPGHFDATFTVNTLRGLFAASHSFWLRVEPVIAWPSASAIWEASNDEV